MRQFQQYQGATPQAAQTTVQKPTELKAPRSMEGEMNAAVATAQAALHQWGKLHDLGVDAAADLEERSINAEMEEEFRKKSNLPWGHKEGLYRADGSKNTDNIERLANTYADKMRKVNRPFFSEENATRAQGESERKAQEVWLNVAKLTDLQEIKNTQQAFEENYHLAIAEERYGDADALASNAVGAGLITETKRKLLKLEAGKARARKAAEEPVNMTINGVTYTDRASAVLAADAARAGNAPTPADMDDEESRENVSDAVTRTTSGTAATLPEGSLTLRAGSETIPANVQEVEKKEPHDLSHAEGMLEKGNIDPYSRKVEHRPDGSIATVESFSVNMDGKEVLLPRVIDGKTVSEDEAIEHYKTTGQHLGKFDTPEHASTYAQKFHENQAAIYGGSETVNDPLGVALSSYLEQDDFAPVFRAMTPTEYSGFHDSIYRESITLRSFRRNDGGFGYEMPPAAPPCVERVVAQANETGEPDKECVQGMVARLTRAEMSENKSATTEQLVKMFKDAGVFTALGDGDEQQGEVRCRAIVEDIGQRAQLGTTKASNAVIQKMVKAHLENDPNFGRPSEWRLMEGLNPRIKAGEKWEPSDEEKQKFGLLRDLYEKYREDYNPYNTEKLTDDEFSKNAQTFWTWYMKESGIYTHQKNADMEAATDWYLGEISARLGDTLSISEGGKANYGKNEDGSYATDMQRVREVLDAGAPNPRRLGVRARARMQEERDAAAAARSVAFRQQAAGDAAKLAEMRKTGETARKAAEKKEEQERRKEEREAERERRKEEREEEKKAKKEEHDAEVLRVRKLNVARHTPRETAWEWDKKDGEDGGAPCALIPKSEYTRLVNELGYDGSQEVFLKYGSGRAIRVVGVSNDDKLKFNTQAVYSVQKKPKKGEHYRTSGKFGYIYEFKATNTTNY